MFWTVPGPGHRSVSSPCQPKSAALCSPAWTYNGADTLVLSIFGIINRPPVRSDKPHNVDCTAFSLDAAEIALWWRSENIGRHRRQPWMRRVRIMKQATAMWFACCEMMSTFFPFITVDSLRTPPRLGAGGPRQQSSTDHDHCCDQHIWWRMHYQQQDKPQ